MENLIEKLEAVKANVSGLPGSGEACGMLTDIIEDLSGKEGEDASAYSMKPPPMIPVKK